LKKSKLSISKEHTELQMWNNTLLWSAL